MSSLHGGTATASGAANGTAPRGTGPDVEDSANMEAPRVTPADFLPTEARMTHAQAGTKVLLYGVTGVARKGELIGVVGPSGAKAPPLNDTTT